MSRPEITARAGKNHAVSHLGPRGTWERFTWKHPDLGFTVSGRLFLKDLLGLTGLEMSVNKLPAGIEVPFHHRHRANEELYVFLDGKGQFQIDGETIDVAEGTVIRVSPAGVRTWRNNSREDLFYLVIQVKAGSLESDEIADGERLPDPVRW